MLAEPISICIPTYRRPALLKECVLSVFSAQTRPLEILVSDDAHDASVADMLAALAPPSGISVRYVANTAGRGQAANVNNLFEQASHERLILMHDDDFFLEGGIDALVAAWEAHGGNVDAAYGRQCIADADGAIDWDATAGNDRAYFKLESVGEQRSALWAALTQQFPNNSMLIRRSIAIKIGYPRENEFGRQVDFIFGLQYAQQSRKNFILIHDYVAAHRKHAETVSRDAISSKKHDGHLLYRFLVDLHVRNGDEKAALELARARFSYRAVLSLIAHDEIAEAFSLLYRYASEMNVSVLARLRLFAYCVAAGLGFNPVRIRG